MKLIKGIYLFIITILISCKPGTNTPEISFYYWKTIFNLNATEQNCLQQNQVKNLYIRYFDVDIKDGLPFPVSPIKFDRQPNNLHVVPVIYIKNQVMLDKNLDNKLLSDKIIDYITQINSKNSIKCNEIQIDCDWSLNSRDKFMNFMQVLKKQWGKTISVTIRLHQVKYYFKTKIPVADYGVLMYYNMGRIAADSLNSVYDRVIALKYINSLKNYPMPLDIALPIFSRGIHISNNKVVNLISKVNLQSFSNDSNYTIINANRVLVKNASLKFGYYFKQNDEIKIESISFDNLLEMAEDLNENVKNSPKRVIFFDLDSINLNNYQHENQDFSKITRRF